MTQLFPLCDHSTAVALLEAAESQRRANHVGYEDMLERLGDAERERDALKAEVEALRKDAERYEDALQKIANWARAYPLKVFPEPDFKRAHEVLTAAGMTLAAISASNMRHVVTQVQSIVDAARAAAVPQA